MQPQWLCDCREWIFCSVLQAMTLQLQHTCLRRSIACVLLSLPVLQDV